MTPAWARFTRRMEAAVEAALGAQGRVQVPEGGEDLWRLFCTLCGGRQGTGAGPSALALPDIEAGARMLDLPLAARHLAVLQAMDRAWLRAAARAREDDAPQGAKILPVMSKAKLTASLFDLSC